MRRFLGLFGHRRSASLLAGLVLAWVESGCDRGSPSRGDAEPLPPGAVVAIIGPVETDGSWPGIRGGALRYDRQYENVECLAVAPTSDDPSELGRVVDRVLAGNPVAVCLYVVRPQVAAPVAQAIRKRGIILVTMGQRLDGEDASGHVQVSWSQAAELLGRGLADLAGDAPNPNLPHVGPSYALLHADGRDLTASQCYTSFSVAARSRGQLSLLRAVNAATEAVPAAEIVSRLVAEFPSVRVVVTLDPEPWLSVHPVLRLPPDNHLATLGACPRLWPRLQAGEALALSGPLDGDIGYAAVELAVKTAMRIPDAPTYRLIPCELVTRLSLADFASRYAAAAGLALADLTPLRFTPVAATRPGGD